MAKVNFNRIALVTALLVIAAVIVLALAPGADPKAPRYVPVTTQPTGPFTYENYNWGDAVPVRDGKLWLWTMNGATNRHAYFYDLNQGRVIGELFDGGVALANPDQSKVLCSGYSSPSTSFKEKVVGWLNRISRSKSPVISTNRIETFWVLDLRDNSARRVGTLAQWPGTGSSWRPAPGFRYGCNVPNNEEEDHAFFLFDFETGAFTKVPCLGNIRGWWDDHQIVVREPAGNFSLFDVRTRKMSALFTGRAVLDFVASKGIQETNGVNTKFNWNGHGYDMYLTGNRKNGLDSNVTYLVKAGHDGAGFSLVYSNFSQHWAGYLDETATHYLYSGEGGVPGRGGNGGVYWCDLTNGVERTLVPPDNAGQYALARQYGDTVIYWRNRVLWRVDVGTTNAVRFFPPPEGK